LKTEIYRLSDQAVMEVFDDGALIMKLNDLTLTELNSTARDILLQIDGSNEIKRVAEFIATEYGIDVAVAEQDIRELYASLYEQGILESN
jgi:hypothetical protein